MASCVQCGVEFEGNTRRKYCSNLCQGRKQWSSLRVALADGDYAGVISAVRADCVVDDDGCWIWQRRTTKDGYAEVTVGGKRLSVHRLVLEAKLGKPLGSQQSHHVCAKSMCVNPDHLQPATYAENIAEMKARHSYIDRIRELEEALGEFNPEHPLLGVAGYALVG